MSAGRSKEGVLDRWAICLSAFCLVHCIASLVLVTALAVGGTFLLDPMFHEVGLGLALVLGLIGFSRGIVRHGYILPAVIGGIGMILMAYALTVGHDDGGTLFAILGVLLVALGHDLNRRAFT
jgi:hypothetical protein